MNRIELIKLLGELGRLTVMGFDRQQALLEQAKQKEIFNKEIEEYYLQLAKEREDKPRTCPECWPDDYGHEIHCTYPTTKLIQDLRKTIKDREALIDELEKRSCCGFILCCQKCGLCKQCTDNGETSSMCVG